MSETARETSPNIFPVLRYRDPAVAVDFLTAAFGFERRMVVPGTDESVAHAELGLGPGTIMLGPAGRDGARPEPSTPAGTVAQGPYIYVADVEAHHERARAAGAEVVQAPYDTDYGSREYAVRDVEGLVWSFGTYLPTAATNPSGASPVA